MKKYTFLFVLVTAGLSLFAQQNPERGERHAAMLKERLSLTEAQYDKVTEINREFAETLARLRLDSTKQGHAAHAERTELMAERDARIKALLTEEQIRKWDTVKRSYHRRPARGNKKSSPLEEMKTAIGLSDDQTRKVMSINRSMAEDFRALRSDTAVNRQNRGAAVSEIIEKRNGKIRKVLTEEQYKAFLAYESEKTQHRRRERQRERH